MKRTAIRCLAAAAMTAALCGALRGQPVPQSFGGASVWPVEPVFVWRCDTCLEALNHNPAMPLDSGASVQFQLPYADNYTVIAVYRPGGDTETDIWRLGFGDSVHHSLSTEHVIRRGGQCGATAIQYAAGTEAAPFVTALRQSSPGMAPSVVGLTAGGGAPVLLAEVQYYDITIGDNALQRIQSSLALRYGITLGPVDYLDGKGEKIWDYEASPGYHNRITGVGQDPLTKLYQPCSRSEMEGAILTVLSGQPGDGIYLIAGDDDGPLTFEPDADLIPGETVYTLNRKWRAQATNTDGTPFTLIFGRPELDTPVDSIVLVVDGTAYLPDSVGGDSLVYGNIEFFHGDHLFTLGYGDPLWQAAGMRSKLRRTDAPGVNGTAATSRAGITASAYPNPTDGRYTLTVTGADRVRVVIYDARGTAVAAFSDSGRERYLFEGRLPSGGIYYAAVSTGCGSQTVKLVVR